MPRGLLLVAPPCAFLLLCFVAPTAYLFSARVLIAEGVIPQDQPTLDNFRLILSGPLYRAVILRTFVVGCFVGLLVVLLAYPLAYFLVRTRSRWKGALIALPLAPLLASAFALLAVAGLLGGGVGMRGGGADGPWIALRVVVAAVFAFALGPILITAAVSSMAARVPPSRRRASRCAGGASPSRRGGGSRWGSACASRR
jgi:ABC-type spermidine/putrescine transport system permease subunit I